MVDQISEAEQARRDEEFDKLTGNLTSRFREAFNRRDIETLRTLYEDAAVSVLSPGHATSGDERKATLEHFYEFDTCESQIRHAYVADAVALLIVDWSMSGPGPDGRRVRISGAATDVVQRDADGIWHYIIDNPFGSGPY